MGELTERVPAAFAGERVDRFVATLTGLTRADVAGLIDDGAVVVGGQVVSSRSRRVQEGDVVSVDVPEATVLVGRDSTAQT